MGTRNLTMVRYKNQYKVAQYGQWDGYPEGQGVKVLNFLKTANLNKFKKQLNKTTFNLPKAYEKKVDKIFNKVNNLCRENREYDTNKILHNLTPTEQFIYRCSTRDTCAGILGVIYTAPDNIKEIRLSNELEFAGDSLFCEWAYLVDLDRNVLEVYRGFNTKPLTVEDRFFNLKLTPHPSGTTYYPIKLLKTYKFNRLPNENTFIKQLTTLSNKLRD